MKPVSWASSSASALSFQIAVPPSDNGRVADTSAPSRLFTVARGLLTLVSTWVVALAKATLPFRSAAAA